MPPYLGELITRERQRETIARADRQRLLSGLARTARRGRPRPSRTRRAALRLARLRPLHRAAR
jgi:hypothetical protein